jgi:hypothetical protein
MSDADAGEVLCAGHEVDSPAWQKLSRGQGIQEMPSSDVSPSRQVMPAWVKYGIDKKRRVLRQRIQ